MSDVFNQKYNKIIEQAEQELNLLNENIYSFFENKKHEKNEIVPIIKEFLNNKGKRIRPVMIFLLAKALNQKIEKLHYDIAIANELIHNATLIHDDIIDCSLIRRNKKTLNFDYDNKLAVLAGDYLLANAIQILNNIENIQIQNIHTQTISHLINGELYQYFNRFKLLPIEEYIEKSKNKTARLFEAGLTAICVENKDLSKNINNFAINFGIAFQIHNDLANIKNTKKICEDIKNGDYSAPIIFYAQEKDIKTIKNPDKLAKDIKNTNAIRKTKELIDNYIDRAIENISFIEDNLYKQALIDLCNLYKTY